MAIDYPFTVPGVSLKAKCRGCPALMLCLHFHLSMTDEQKAVLQHELDKYGEQEGKESEGSPTQETPVNVDRDEHIDMDTPDMSVWRSVLDDLPF